MSIDDSEMTGGPLEGVPTLLLNEHAQHARMGALAEFLDVPRPLEVVREGGEDDGSRAHARGLVSWFSGDLRAAHAAFEMAVASRRSLTRGDPRLAASLNALGATAIALHDAVRGSEHLTQAVALRAEWLGTSAPQTAVTESNLGVARFILGQFDEAAELCSCASQKLIELGGSWEMRGTHAASCAARAYDRLGRHTEARAWLAVAKRHRLDAGELASELIVN
ncbi:MAG: tetratricopeptide repeat protein [Kofleriaceae bacterium]|nr:tetratricopeptide repeat protein [Kofleriaceae bacterium]